MMKKVYEKPDILFEDFSLCTDIAVGCEVIANHSYNVCVYEEDDGRGNVLTVFTEDVMGCVYKPANGNHNGLCYHNPSITNTLFTS